MQPNDTKTHLLAAAEQLFAENGFAATSLRALTAAAGANLAAVHYHFGSKEGLLQAVLARRLDPLNRERLERLDAHEREAGPDGPRLEAILEALLAPALQLSDPHRGGAVFLRLLGRVYTEPNPRLERFFMAQFAEVIRRFTAAIRRALPELSEEELFWRLHFSIGAMAHTMADSFRLQVLSDGRCDPSDPDRVLAHLVPFLAAGFRCAAADLAAPAQEVP